MIDTYGLNATYVSTCGSRSKTHARRLVSERHLKIWTCVLLQWRKAAKAWRKISGTVCEYHYLYKIRARKHDHNSLSRFSSGAKGRERVAKARRKGSFGDSTFEQRPSYWC